MYWHIGERINREVLGNERAEYGRLIVSTVSTQLQLEFGKSCKNGTEILEKVVKTMLKNWKKL